MYFTLWATPNSAQGPYLGLLYTNHVLYFEPCPWYIPYKLNWLFCSYLGTEPSSLIFFFLVETYWFPSNITLKCNLWSTSSLHILNYCRLALRNRPLREPSEKLAEQVIVEIPKSKQVWHWSSVRQDWQWSSVKPPSKTMWESEGENRTRCNYEVSQHEMGRGVSQEK